MSRVVQGTTHAEIGAVAGGGEEVTGGGYTTANAEQTETATRGFWLGILARLGPRSKLTRDQRSSARNTYRAQAAERIDTVTSGVQLGKLAGLRQLW